MATSTKSGAGTRTEQALAITTGTIIEIRVKGGLGNSKGGSRVANVALACDSVHTMATNQTISSKGISS